MDATTLELVMRTIETTESSTLSMLHATIRSGARFEYLGFVCFVVEDGFNEQKVFGRTRIPQGTYMINKRDHGGLFQRYSSRFGHKFVPELMDVPNYTNILIHMGNTVGDTKGCLLPNMGCQYIEGGMHEDDQWKGVQSKEAYLKIYDLIQNTEKAIIRIFR